LGLLVCDGEKRDEMVKKIVIIVVAVVIAIFVLSFVKDAVAKVSVEKGTQLVTGLRLTTKSLKVGIINTRLAINQLRLFNPEGYRDEVMLDMPEIYVDYSLIDFIKGKLHVEEMRIDMKEFTVVKNENGELNLDSLKVVQAQKEGKKPQEKEKTKPLKMQIDVLSLKIGKVIYKDYSKKKGPSVREFELNLDEKYENITDPYTLVSLLVTRALIHTTIARLTDFDLRGLEGSVSDSLASAQELATEAAVAAQEALEDAAEKSEEALKQTQQKAKEAAGDLGEGLKDTTESLKDKIKLPFR